MARTQTEQREYIPKSIKRQVLQDCNGVCSHCGTPLTLGENFTLEHVIPLSKGGKNDINNYVALCETCNKTKSNDVIEPMTYYTHLTTAKKEQLQKLFDEYCDTVDWLNYDNLFKTDKFDIVTSFPVWLRNGMMRRAPITFHVEKVQSDVAFEFLQPYAEQLCDIDKKLMAKTPDELGNAPYYKITTGTETVMFMSAYITGVGKSRKTAVNTIMVDIYIKPGLKKTRRTIPALYGCINHVIDKIQQTLRHANDKKTTMRHMIRTIRSDTLGCELLQEYQRMYSDSCFYLPNKGDPDDFTKPCIMCTGGVLFQGTQQDLSKMIKDSPYDNPYDFAFDAGRHQRSMQSTIDMRLKQAKAETDAKPKPKQKPLAVYKTPPQK